MQLRAKDCEGDVNTVRFALAVFFALAVMNGQATVPQPLVIQSDVREVVVPVIVTDENGRYVRTLSRDDFQVLENGKPQKIVAFSRSLASPLETKVDGGAPSAGALPGQ